MGSVGDRLLPRNLAGIGALLGALIASSMLADANAQQPLQGEQESPAPVSAGAGQPFTLSPSQAQASIQWLASLAMQKMPRTFYGDKHWGDTKKVWAGVKMRLDGLRLKTHRRWRELEHGRWVQYEVTLPPHNAPHAADIVIQEVTPEIDANGQPRWVIASTIVAPMRFKARVQRWNLGVKLFSMTISGDMQIRMTSLTSIAFHADYSEIPPAFVVDPHVQAAQMSLERFEVNRISHLGGDLAEGWGELLQEILVERFVKKQNERLVSKLNKSIEKERDDLRLSMTDWLVQLSVDSGQLTERATDNSR